MANKISARAIFQALKSKVKKSSPAIMMGISIAGVIVTAFSAANDGPKCEEIIDDYNDMTEEIKKQAEEEEWTDKELSKKLWKLRGQFVLDMGKALWRTLLSGGITILSIIFSHKIQFRRQAVLASLLNQTELAYRDYVAATRERLNKKDLEAIEEKIGEYHAARNQNVVSADPVLFSAGDVPYFEPLSNQLIMSNEHKIEGAKNALNDYLNRVDKASMNDFLDFLEADTWRGGDKLGWDRNHDGLVEWYSRPSEYYNKSTGLKTPCLEICFYTEPHSSYVTC